MAITFEIPSGQVVSLNSWQRMHWAQRRRLQAEVDKIVYFSAHSERAAFSKIRVSLTQHGRRAMDPDNLIGGTGKVVHDAIVCRADTGRRARPPCHRQPGIPKGQGTKSSGTN